MHCKGRTSLLEACQRHRVIEKPPYSKVLQNFGQFVLWIILLAGNTVAKSAEFSAFLRLPLDVQCSGKACDPTTAKISAIVDHSGQLYCARGNACDNKVVAFDGTIRERTTDALACEFRDGKLRLASGYANPDLQPIQLSGINYVSSNSCGASRRAYLNYDGHAGTDFPYPLDTRVVAPASGLLDLPSDDELVVPGGNKKYNTVRITHDNGLSTLYFHMQLKSTPCESDPSNPCIRGGPAVRVNQGDLIGLVGKEGAAGAHLHFEVIRSSPGPKYNPYKTAGDLIDPYCANQNVSSRCTGYLWQPAGSPQLKLYDAFDGTVLQSTYWTSMLDPTISVSDGIATFGCRSLAATKGKLEVSGDDKIVIESRFASPGSGSYRTSALLLYDTLQDATDFIVAGDTSYSGPSAPRPGMFIVGAGAFATPIQDANGVSVSAYKEYRLTVIDKVVQIERGDTLDAISETFSVTLPSSVVGRRFYVGISSGNVPYCPSTFDWIRIYGK